jgi:dihydropteroate synthase
VLSLSALAALANQHASELDLPVRPLLIGNRTFGPSDPVLMGALNLSRESTYRDSIATSVDDAIRKGRVMAAQGAAVIDIGAESTTARTSRVSAEEQAGALVPVIKALTADGIELSVESYEASVVREGLAAGARVVNLTGVQDQAEILDLAAEHDATVILCYVRGANVREIADVTLDEDPIPELLDHFGGRLEAAGHAGVARVVIDPGMGFYYGNLTDPATRVQHQARVLLNSFRLRALGVPLCQALPHAFDLFGDEYRTAEGFFATLAFLGGTSMYRTHEVPRVRAVLDALSTLTLP